MLLQHRVVQVQALQVVVPSQLLRLVADLPERVLGSRAGEQLRAAHEGQELRDLLIDGGFHAQHTVLQLNQEIAVLRKKIEDLF